MEDNNPPVRAKSASEMPAILDGLIQHSPVPDTAIDATKPLPRLKLSQVLPKDQWWRLYIAPHDHEKALARASKENPPNPGFLYDTEKSQGFQVSMVYAYEQTLEGDVDAALFNQATLTYNDYKRFHEMVTAKIVKTIQERELNEHLQFPLIPDIIAADAGTDLVLDRPLLKSLNDAGATRPISLCYPWVKSKCMTNTLFAECPPVVNAIFLLFHHAILSATTRKGQLRAIAQLVRHLHVLHTFKDGNGRLNVYFVLPRLLLQYGFGLPIELGDRFHPDTMDTLFNGNFTLDQIVCFLWYAQHPKPH